MADVEAKKVCGMPERVQLHVAMLALQFGYAGFHVVSRAALNMGISKVVFPVYRNIIALVLLIPFAYFLEKKDRPAMSLSFAVQFFLLALCGVLPARPREHVSDLRLRHPELCSGHHLPHGRPSQARRIEKVRFDRRDGVAKMTGTLACVAGATIITLYKGPTIFGPSKMTLNSTAAPATMLWLQDDRMGKSWTLGCIYLIGHCLSWSGWLVLQAPVLKKYPARLSVTSYTCFFGVIQFLIIAAFLERDTDAWRFHSGSELFTILYAGFVASGIAFAVQIWCIDRGGPVFVAVYQPVQTLVVAIMASIALGEEFYLGGIIGAIFIIAGLYLVLWGKSEERAFTAREAAAATSSNPEHDALRTAAASFKASSIKQPLLPTSTTSESV
ncbi:hypothetical protein ZIOFF_021175 [Zingiber officinale]|uniref:WAT1-related protein n=1 Tax=Zingiber officinale TaxID=94328 RepID=A0A8J5H9E5_ZINOF|nr:hypothetical protein ZIOFF_021175 [Zingiber officinale]